MLMMKNLKALQEITKNLNVLYVEDDTDILKRTAVYFRNFFEEVRAAKDGEEGLSMYKTQDFDIVITDILMPKMNGTEMLEEIRKINPHQIALITTAHTDSATMLAAIKIGVDGYIIKPFDFEQMNSALFKAAQKIQIYKENEVYKSHLSEIVEEKTHELEDLLAYQDSNYQKTLSSMVEIIEQRDTYTAGHSKRVAEYSQKIAQQMGYLEDDCTLIYHAGILHDVGKIATPDAVLLNPKALNDLEYKLIQEHVSVSYKLLHKIPMFKYLSDIVYSHHERYDGTGYPRGLKADEIPELARIMIVADAFDAMTTNRIYKSRNTIAQALVQLEKFSGSQFDPLVAENAIIALKDVEIDEKINQLPQTKLEEERFAYFYKDTLSEAYNQQYLDVVLMKNKQEKYFNFMSVISLKNFSEYNKENGWKNGDKLLTEVASLLSEHFPDAYLFRVFGDDFVMMSEENYKEEKIKDALGDLLAQHQLKYQVDIINLQDQDISMLSEIETFQKTKKY